MGTVLTSMVVFMMVSGVVLSWLVMRNHELKERLLLTNTHKDRVTMALNMMGLSADVDGVGGVLAHLEHGELEIVSGSTRQDVNSAWLFLNLEGWSQYRDLELAPSYRTAEGQPVIYWGGGGSLARLSFSLDEGPFRRTGQLAGDHDTLLGWLFPDLREALDSITTSPFVAIRDISVNSGRFRLRIEWSEHRLEPGDESAKPETHTWMSTEYAALFGAMVAAGEALAWCGAPLGQRIVDAIGSRPPGDPWRAQLLALCAREHELVVADGVSSIVVEVEEALDAVWRDVLSGEHLEEIQLVRRVAPSIFLTRAPKSVIMGQAFAIFQEAGGVHRAQHVVRALGSALGEELLTDQKIPLMLRLASLSAFDWSQRADALDEHFARLHGEGGALYRVELCRAMHYVPHPLSAKWALRIVHEDVMHRSGSSALSEELVSLLARLRGYGVVDRELDGLVEAYTVLVFILGREELIGWIEEVASREALNALHRIAEHPRMGFGMKTAAMDASERIIESLGLSRGGLTLSEDERTQDGRLSLVRESGELTMVEAERGALTALPDRGGELRQSPPRPPAGEGAPD